MTAPPSAPPDVTLEAPPGAAARVTLREAAVVVVALLVVMAVTFSGVLFDGRSVVYSDNYNFLEGLVDARNHGPDFVPASEWARRNLGRTANFHDPAAAWSQWEAGALFLRRAVRDGEWPVWDPHVAAGAPALANLTQSFFFPPYAAVVLLGNTPLLRNAYHLALLVAAAVCTHLLLRRHGISAVAAATSAVAVLSCGALHQNVASLIGQTSVCLPPALLLTRWFLERATWRRAAALAVGYGGIALSSFPPLLVAVFGTAGVYACVFVAAHATPGRRALRYLVAAASGIALAAFLYVPAFAAARLPQIAAAYAGAGRETLRWPVLGQLLTPVLLGGEKVQADPPVRDLDSAGVPYAGVVALLLASLARPPAGREGRWLFLALWIAIVIATAKLLGIEPVQSLGRLPALSTIHFKYYLGIPLSLLACVLTGFGVEALRSGRCRLRQLLVGAGLLAAALAGIRWVAVARGALSHAHAEEWVDGWMRLVALLAAAVALALPLCLAGARLPPWARYALLGGLVVLVAGEGVANNRYPRQKRWDVWRNPPPYVWQLAHHAAAGRVFSDGLFHANAGSAFEVDQLDSLMAFNPERVFQLYQHHVSPRAHQFLREAGRLPPEGVLDAANVGLIALRAAHRAMILDALGRGARELFADGEARLLRRQTEPRYYFTTAYRVGTRDEVLAGVGSRQPREVLLEEAPGFPRSPATTPHPLVRVTERRLGRVTVRLRAPRPGLLYASESYAPGWRAEVDGRAVPILAANHAFRAVAVPAGDVTVTFRYRPPGLPAGLALSLLALVAVVAMASRRDDGLSTEAPPRPARRLRWLPWAALALLAGGVVLRIASGAPAAELRAVLGTRRPPAEGDLYRVRWEALELPPTVVAGRPFEARVTLRNVSSEPWLDPVNADPSGSGRNAVRLSYRWLDAPGRALGDFAARADLPHPVAPGGAVSLRLVVVPPATPGSYQLQLDLVHEMVAWFEGRGVPRYATPIEVEPPATAP